MNHFVLTGQHRRLALFCIMPKPTNITIRVKTGNIKASLNKILHCDYPQSTCTRVSERWTTTGGEYTDPSPPRQRWQLCLQS